VNVAEGDVGRGCWGLRATGWGYQAAGEEVDCEETWPFRCVEEHQEGDDGNVDVVVVVACEVVFEGTIEAGKQPCNAGQASLDSSSQASRVLASAVASGAAFAAACSEEGAYRKAALCEDVILSAGLTNQRASVKVRHSGEDHYRSEFDENIQGSEVLLRQGRSFAAGDHLGQMACMSASPAGTVATEGVPGLAVAAKKIEAGESRNGVTEKRYQGLRMTKETTRAFGTTS
jgi:hypothetical protein